MRRRPILAGAAVGLGIAALATLLVRLRERQKGAPARALVESRRGRGAALARLALRAGGRVAARSPQLVFASVERRAELRHDLALRTAEEVAGVVEEELGAPPERVFRRWDSLPFAAA